MKQKPVFVIAVCRIVGWSLQGRVELDEVEYLALESLKVRVRCHSGGSSCLGAGEGCDEGRLEHQGDPEST